MERTLSGTVEAWTNCRDLMNQEGLRLAEFVVKHLNQKIRRRRDNSVTGFIIGYGTAQDGIVRGLTDRSYALPDGMCVVSGAKSGYDGWDHPENYEILVGTVPETKLQQARRLAREAKVRFEQKRVEEENLNGLCQRNYDVWQAAVTKMGEARQARYLAERDYNAAMGALTEAALVEE